MSSSTVPTLIRPLLGTLTPASIAGGCGIAVWALMEAETPTSDSCDNGENVDLHRGSSEDVVVRTAVVDILDRDSITLISTLRWLHYEQVYWKQSEEDRPSLHNSEVLGGHYLDNPAVWPNRRTDHVAAQSITTAHRMRRQSSPLAMEQDAASKCMLLLLASLPWVL
ncbi:hypothetical protein B0H16DRAFT_1897749, partial [Mycena metata]